MAALHYHFGLLVLLACFFLETVSRPSNNELSTTQQVEEPIEKDPTKQEKSLPEEQTVETDEISTQEILNKIKVINDKLKRPQKQQINYNNGPYLGGGYVLDKAILEKLQQIIAASKVNVLTKKQPEENIKPVNENQEYVDAREGSPRALQYVQPSITSNALPGQQIAYVPLPYVTNIPVMVMPNVGNGYLTNNNLNTIQSTQEYSTRQGPSLPFQIQWPLAQFFPVLLKDPLLHYLGGGSWENLIEYGQNADICHRKQKSGDVETEDDDNTDTDEEKLTNDISSNPLQVVNSRQGRKLKKIKKRTVSKSSSLQTLIKEKGLPSLFQKPSTVKPLFAKPITKIQDTKETYAEEGDLRLPFGDFTWFGNRKPTAPSPGFFINRLKVRRGGVAIAGPGGVATAGRGGAAIVGPGGLAYTQPGGLAVAGPAAKVVALSSDTDLNNIVTRLQQQSAIDGSIQRMLQAIPEGKVVATGPVVYYHP